jgi:hypothetical protein
MRIHFYYKDSKNKLILDVKEHQNVKEIKRILEDSFKIDTSNNDTERKRVVLEYAGCDLKDDWILNDLAIPVGMQVKCFTVDEKESDFVVHVKYSKETLTLYNTELDPSQSTVFELKLILSDLLGFPLSIFRLKVRSSMIDMFDDNLLYDYFVFRRHEILLEIWHGWENFLRNCVKGFHAQVIKTCSHDEFIKQYQLRVALHIAAHYGNVELAAYLMAMGVRPDRPVGEVNIKKWENKIDYK